jgi:hypothetical protein
MKRVYLARNPADAHLFKGILESHHIQAVVHGDFLWSARGVEGSVLNRNAFSSEMC